MREIKHNHIHLASNGRLIAETVSIYAASFGPCVPSIECVCMRVYMRVWMLVYVRKHAHNHVYVYACIQTCVWVGGVRVCGYMHVHACMCVIVCVCPCIWVCMCVYA